MKVHEIIRQCADDLGSSDPDEVTAAVLETMSEAQLRAALYPAMREAVRRVFQSGRKNARAAVANRAATPAIGRNRWEKFRPLLNERIVIAGEYRFMAECTAEDFDQAAMEHDARAEEIMAVATSYREYASALRFAQAATLGELVNGPSSERAPVAA